MFSQERAGFTPHCFPDDFISILEYGMYYYLVYIQNNTVRYALVHTCNGTTSTHVTNVVATKMNGTKKDAIRLHSVRSE